MIASGVHIRWNCRGERPMVSPFSERTVHESGLTYGLGPAGYDVRVRTRVVLYPGSLNHDPSYPGFACVDALETFEMPDTLLGVVHDKSTWAREGLAVQNTVIEPGWRGVLRLELTNHGRRTLILEAGTPVAQVLFHMLDQPCESYTGRYQDQGEGQDAIWQPGYKP